VAGDLKDVECLFRLMVGPAWEGGQREIRCIVWIWT